MSGPAPIPAGVEPLASAGVAASRYRKLEAPGQNVAHRDQAWGPGEMRRLPRTAARETHHPGDQAADPDHPDADPGTHAGDPNSFRGDPRLEPLLEDHRVSGKDGPPWDLEVHAGGLHPCPKSRPRTEAEALP